MTRASWLAGEATAFGVQTHANDVTKRRGLFIRIRHTHSQLGMDTWDHPDPFSSNTKTSNSAPINTPLCTPPCRLATPRQTTFQSSFPTTNSASPTPKQVHVPLSNRQNKRSTPLQILLKPSHSRNTSSLTACHRRFGQNKVHHSCSLRQLKCRSTKPLLQTQIARLLHDFFRQSDSACSSRPNH